MIKTLLIGFNFIGLFFFNFFMPSDVMITHNLPDSLQPGEQKEVQITINKGDIKGFAKLQVEVNSGIVVTSLQNSGASFTFSDSKAKFIWVDLPSTTDFSIKFNIKADENANGDNLINIRFSYIDNNERKNVDSPMHTIKIGTALADNSSSIAQEKIIQPTEDANKIVKDIDQNVSQLADKIVKAENNEPLVQNNQPTSVQNVEIIRSIKRQDNGNYIVSLEIQKDDVNGFAKLEETVPEEFSAVNLESEKAIFSNGDKLVKFVWFSIPSDNLIKVSYMLIPAVTNPVENFSVTGDFSFLDKEGTTQKIMIDQTNMGNTQSILANNAKTANIIESNNLVPEQTSDIKKIEEVKSEQIKEVEKVEEATNTEDLTSKIVNETESEQSKIEEAKVSETKVPEKISNNLVSESKKLDTVQQNLAETTQIVNAKITETVETYKAAEPDKTDTKINKTTIYPITRIPYPEKGITYRVQISAAKKIVDKVYFETKYSFNKEFMTENHEGWIKYTTGGYTNYKEARDEREILKASYRFPGPFVTAYSDGTRITVQEALMATNQKWVS